MYRVRHGYRIMNHGPRRNDARFTVVFYSLWPERCKLQRLLGHQTDEVVEKWEPIHLIYEATYLSDSAEAKPENAEACERIYQLLCTLGWTHFEGTVSHIHKAHICSISGFQSSLSDPSDFQWLALRLFLGNSFLFFVLINRLRAPQGFLGRDFYIFHRLEEWLLLGQNFSGLSFFHREGLSATNPAWGIPSPPML